MNLCIFKKFFQHSLIHIISTISPTRPSTPLPSHSSILFPTLLSFCHFDLKILPLGVSKKYSQIQMYMNIFYFMNIITA